MKTSHKIGALLAGVTAVAVARANRGIPQATVTSLIDAPADRAFDYIVPVSLPHIFKGYNLMPAIVGTSISEGWNKPGLTRTVYFEDDSTATEHLLTVVSPTSFSYQLDGFTSPLRFLAKRIEGNWLFTDLNGQTKIEWTYRVIPLNFLARILVNAVLIKDIRGMLTDALATLKEDLEGNNRQN